MSTGGGRFDKQVWTATIADICKHIQSGGTPKAGNSDYYGGTIPWLRTQEVNWNEIYDTDVKITEQGLKNSSAKMIPENCVIVAMYGATAGKVAINKIPLTTNQACCNLEIDETKALYRYVFHWLSKEYLSLKALGQGSQSNINAQTVKQYPIPIPPLEVQQRIVTVLDNFDVICSDLNIGLPAEIEARKKQYEYYRDMLLTFAAADDIILTDRQTDRQSIIELLQYVFGYVKLPVSDIIYSLKTGLNPRQNFKLNVGGTIPYITGKDIYSNSVNISERTDRITEEALQLINRRAALQPGLLLFASTGTGTVGRMAIVHEYQNDWGISETLYAIKADETIVMPEFLMYMLYSADAKNQFEPKISKGSVPHLKVADLLNVCIAVPTLKKQNEIVSVLKHFDTLCNDLTKGLPAEIEARQKQYEYYRDKLLTFKELGA